MSELGPGLPIEPIPLGGPADGTVRRLGGTAVELDDGFLVALRGACQSVSSVADEVVAASRDWWPLAMTWAGANEVAALAGVVARPADADEVAAVLRLCNRQLVPVTPVAGRSGVCGGSVPVHGGVALDLTALDGVRAVDPVSNVVDVGAGTFGDHLEAELRADHGLTLGHWPQSVALSTVGGWLACRSAGQLSTRYGKIEDMVVGLDIVLADGTLLHTGGHPAAATGPDLDQLFVGAEGTLGVITGARLRLHPVPAAEIRRAFSFATFEAGLAACRRVLQRGATPAVLRLYDPVESKRNYELDDACALIVLDEADPAVLEATASIVDAECTDAAPLDLGLVESWLAHRNDVSALESLIGRGYVIDTMEISGPWSVLDDVYGATLAAMSAVEGTLAVSAHQSHAYVDGACLYFTFGGAVGDGLDERSAYYRRMWDVGTTTVLANGGSLSHHHGVGLNRARFMADAHGSAFDVLASIKQALDPNGIMNPGKLGLPDPWEAPEGWT